MNIYMAKSCSECLFNGRLFMQLENAIFIFLQSNFTAYVLSLPKRNTRNLECLMEMTLCLVECNSLPIESN